MNFFEHQEQARRQTHRLILLFTVAVLSLILLTDLLVVAILLLGDSQQYLHFADIPASLHLVIAMAVLLVVACAILYKFTSLREGGVAVALNLGGLPVQGETQNPQERRLLNIVEEMAIASGTPVPVVYILEDKAINAFAAGFSPHDAVIGVTRGALETLERDELQGVIAHEFSHILNGDMRLNLRLIGILFGILFIALLGQKILRIASGSRQGAVFALLGIGLIIVGYSGYFFGSLIKAAFSRQREFLADAAAVQFTRNPAGIGGALKKIGGWSIGSVLALRNTAEYSHFFIAQALSVWATGLFTTHPPLATRIKRINPQWDGHYPEVKRHPGSGSLPSHTQAMHSHTTPFITVTTLASAIAQSGTPAPHQLSEARRLLQQIPARLVASTRDPQGAYALALGLLLPSNATTRSLLVQQLNAICELDIRMRLQSLLSTLESLDCAYRLPLVELCLPNLRQLSVSQQAALKRCLQTLIKADNKVEIWEWTLYRLFMLALSKPEPAPGHYKSPTQIAEECRLLIAAVVYSSGQQGARHTDSFFIAASRLGLSTVLPEKQKLNHQNLNQALKKARRLRPLQKPALLKALCDAAQHDGIVYNAEIELIRLIAESIDCPVPPLSATQPA